MSLIQILAVAGGLCGSLGSILTAFSVSSQLWELNFARKAVNFVAEQLAHKVPDIKFPDGLDTRFEAAAKRDGRLLWIGVVLLVAGFVLQAASTFMAP